MQQVTRTLSINPATPGKSLSPLMTGHFKTSKNYGTVREAGTNDWLLIYTVAGSGKLSTKTESLQTKPGDVALWPPRTYHDYRIAPDCRQWEILWAHFLPLPHWHQILAWPVRLQCFYFLSIADTGLKRRIRSELLQMHASAAGTLLHNRRLFAFNALEKALLLCDTINPVSTEARLDPRVSEAVDLLGGELSRENTLDALAEKCGLSPSRLAHLFKEQIGASPMEYLEQQRLKRAMELLEHTAFSVKEIAAMVGFASPFYFSRRFCLKTGTCPREYRRKFEGEK
jgi:AraC family transcriptional regulator, arabinose operon regulatory protein